MTLATMRHVCPGGGSKLTPLGELRRSESDAFSAMDSEAFRSGKKERQSLPCVSSLPGNGGTTRGSRRCRPEM